MFVNLLDNITHIPVLLSEVVDNLTVPSKGRILDLTIGLGGHAKAILNKCDAETRYLGVDRDPEAIAWTKNKFRFEHRITIIKSAYEEVLNNADFLTWMQCYAPSGFDAILMDLGVSGLQMKDGNRGFSFMLNGPLDMRMDTTSGITALEWLTKQTEHTLAVALYQYGEERAAKSIAKAILRFLHNGALHTTSDLAEAVYTVLPKNLARRKKQINPATRTFQAIRVAVNNELSRLSETIVGMTNLLQTNGRLGIISFHSLEDRIVKHTLRHLSGVYNGPGRFPASPLPKYLRLIHVGGLTPKMPELAIKQGYSTVTLLAKFLG